MPAMAARPRPSPLAAYRELLLAAALLAVVAAAGWALTDPGFRVPGRSPDGSVSLLVGLTHRDCELPRLAGFAQPVNAWSALALVAVGLGGLVVVGRARRRGHLPPPGVVAFGAAVIVAGVGSLAFHRSPTAWSSWLDALGVAAIAGVWAVNGVARLRYWADRPRLIAYGAVAGASGLLLAVLPKAAADAFLVALVGAAAVVGAAALRHRDLTTTRDRRLAGAALAVFAVAAPVWALSREGGPWCQPASALQGHAAWHVLAAVALAILTAYLWSERPSLPSRGGRRRPQP